MKKIIPFLVACFITFISYSQNIDKIINASNVKQIEKVLSSDKMQGRKTFTPFIDSAANFIAGEFKKSGLKYFNGLTSYRQPFSMLKANIIFVSGNMNGCSLDSENIIAITTNSEVKFDENSGYTKVIIGDTANFFKEAFNLLKDDKNILFW